MILKALKAICKLNFGSFENDEFKKFLRMGLIFALIIGIYWTLRPLKDAIFIQFVDKLQLPLAKTVSVIALLPLVIAYTKLISKTSKEKMLVILPAFYGVMILLFSLLMLLLQSQVSVISSQSTLGLISIRCIGYGWYLFVESFGSLVVALFWAFAADCTKPEHAKRGFPLIVAIGQIGGIIFPYLIGGLPHRMGLKTDSASMLLLGIFTLVMITSVRSFLKKTPPALLAIDQKKETSSKHEAGFLEGLRILVSNKYLLGIFTVTFIYEVAITIFDFNFKISAASTHSGVALSHYLSLYASSVNIVSLSCLLLGISNITRFLGIKAALALMPLIVAAALISFLSLDTLQFLFALMVGAKAINYALNGPALKQLYIPTTTDTKFKAQAWIETFGSRTSKQAGSFFNMSLSVLQRNFGSLVGKNYYLTLVACLCTPLIAIWFFVALFLGKTFTRAVNENVNIC